MFPVLCLLGSFPSLTQTACFVAVVRVVNLRAVACQADTGLFLLHGFPMPCTHHLKKSMKKWLLQNKLYPSLGLKMTHDAMPLPNRSSHFSPVEHPSAQQSQDKHSTALSWKGTWFENPHCWPIPESDSSSPRDLDLPPLFRNAAWLYNSLVACGGSSLVSLPAFE